MNIRITQKEEEVRVRGNRIKDGVARVKAAAHRTPKKATAPDDAGAAGKSVLG
jgi:hypothetical protein